MSKSENWRKVVLRSMPAPAWLAEGAPRDDIVVSCRCRAARNLYGYPFPHQASVDQAREIADTVWGVLEATQWQFECLNRLSAAERDYLLGCRLISADFQHNQPGRYVILDESRSLSIMVNEEDHLRLQVLTPGWSIHQANQPLTEVLQIIESKLGVMHTERHGYLTASPTNLGAGTRYSALFHLIGLAHEGRLSQVLKALASWGLVARGLFGESSRAVGAFFQLSSTSGRIDELAGACEYLIREEAESRSRISEDEVRETMVDACKASLVARTLALADSIRILSWVRWAATVPEISKRIEVTHREVDSWLSHMEVHGTTDLVVAARHRAEFVRARLEPILVRDRASAQPS